MNLNPLRAGVPPRWATAWGEDRYGAFLAFTVGEVEHRLRWIPPGRFWMGSPEGEAGRQEDEGPRHEVLLTRGYWLGEVPVTQELWETVMGSNPSRFKGARHPVESVSWEECGSFLDQLNGKVAGLEVRLPTEAEWERACRGETEGATWVGELTLSPDRSRAAELEGIAWYRGNSSGTSHPVKEKLPNPFGLHDMLGNVWEWCADWRGSYEGTPAIDPTGFAEGPHRVLRGGSWDGDAKYVRSAVRFAFLPNVRSDAFGLRLARGQR